MTTSDQAIPEVTLEPTQAPEATPAPTAEPTPAPTKAPQKLTSDALEPPAPVATKVTQVAQKAVSRYDQLLANLQAKGQDETKIVINGLLNYAKKMDPKKPMSPAQGVMHQFELASTLRYALNAEPEVFKEAWQFILAFAKEHANGVFHIRHINRFPEQWQWGEEQLRAFLCIINIISLTADPQTRATGLKQVHLGRSMQVGFSERAQQNVLSFYG